MGLVTLTAQPKFTQEVSMTRRTAFNGSAAGRRRERLKAAAMARGIEARPEVISSEVLHRPTPSRITLSLKRDNYTPQRLKDVASKAAVQVHEYKNQIIRATYLFEHEFKRNKIESGSVCLPQVAVYSAGHRKSESVTAR